MKSYKFYVYVDEDEGPNGTIKYHRTAYTRNMGPHGCAHFVDAANWSAGERAAIKEHALTCGDRPTGRP